MEIRECNKPATGIRTELLISLELAQEKIRQQLAIGEILLNTRLTSKSALREAEAGRDRWTDFNIELMTRLLSGNEYAERYRLFHSSIQYQSWTLEDEIRYFRAVVAEQCNQLKSDLDRLPLIPESQMLRGQFDSVKASGKLETPTAQYTTNFYGSVGSVAQHSHGFTQKASLPKDDPERKVHQPPSRRKSKRDKWMGQIGALTAVLSLPAAWLAVPGIQEWAKNFISTAGSAEQKVEVARVDRPKEMQRTLPHAPSAEVEKQTHVGRREPINSLRRRTIQLANDLGAFLAERYTKRPTDAEDQRQYDQATVDLYLSRYKSRTVGVLQELQAKGLDIGLLNAPGAAPSRYLLADELRQLRDLAYHLDGNDRVVSF